MLILKVTLNAVAAVIIFIEQLRAEGKFKRVTLLLALLLVVGSAILTVVEHYTSARSERERIANLAVIQKLCSPLGDLAFELKLKDVDSTRAIPIGFQIEVAVHTRSAGTGVFADYISIGYSRDKGWFSESSTFKRYRNLTFEPDSENKSVRFVLRDFSVSASWKQDRAGWEPANVADLARVRLELTAFALNPEDNERFYDYEWCPIERVYIYASTFDAANLLAIAERIPKTPNTRMSAYHHFLPKWDKSFNSPDARRFKIEPLRLRESIISSTD